MVRIPVLAAILGLSVFRIANAMEVPLETEMQLLQLSSHAGRPVCIHHCLATENDAHLAASRRFLRIALKVKREVSWRVYRLADATYAYSYPSVGEQGATQSRMPPLFPEYEYVSAGHIHWDGVWRFSPQDWNWVAKNNRTLFLATDEGVLRKAIPRMARRVARSGGLATRDAVSFAGQRVARIATPAVEMPAGASTSTAYRP
ncbi:MAG TPA: hypothetical protein VF267_05785 [Gammaproteobacteria bacterium]